MSFEHAPEEWDWAREALAGAEAFARAVDDTHSSETGLKVLIATAERLPEGVAGTAFRLNEWRRCDHFLTQEAVRLASLRSLLLQTEVPENTELLARDRQAVLAQFASPHPLVQDTVEITVASERWLEGYRRHYLAWHARAHAAARFEELAALRRSPKMEVARRLAQVGLLSSEVSARETELAQVLGRRCLAGDPLPPGQTVCPLCGLKFGEDVMLPDAKELGDRISELLVAQTSMVAAQQKMLQRRVENIADATKQKNVTNLIIKLGQEQCSCPTELPPLLTDDVLTWLRQQLTQPTARKRDLVALTDALRGKELTAREILRLVQEWLDAEGEEVVEVG
jgi:hypothetical protein